MINFAATIIQQSLAYPAKLAYRDGTEDVSYQVLSTRIKQTAVGLTNKGLEPGDHVIITMEDCVDWPVVFLACLYRGIVPLPLSTAMGQELFSDIANFIECKTIIAGDEVATRINMSIPVITRSELRDFYNNTTAIEPVMIHPDAPGYMNISSGSTGLPKVAVHRHQTLFEILKLSPEISFSMTCESVILSVAKMSWNFGLHNSITYTVGLGATAILIPDPPAGPTVFEYINQFNPTIVVTSPSIIRRLLKLSDKYTLPSTIKHFHSSGEHLPAALYDQFLQRFNIKLNSCIGMMETCTNYAANPDFAHDRGTVGKALPNCKVKIVDDNGNICLGNTVGEIFVSSPANACYYYKNYEKTKQTFIGEWIKTGDLAYYNELGNLVFVGRIDDVFKINDLIVSPVEIESTILKNTNVEQVVVTGVKNNQGLIELHAFVIPYSQDFNLDEFKKFLVNSLFPHQIPKKIHVVDQLSETMTNKKDRKTMSKIVENAN